MIPTDTATPAQRARYEEYAASRTPSDGVSPQGPARMMFAPDSSGRRPRSPSGSHEHAAFAEIDEVAFALPFTFEHDDYVQILTDMAEHLGPALGWTPPAAAR